MKPATCVLVLFISVSSLSMSLRGADLYVSPQGNDEQAGSFDAPLQTLHAAQQAVRRLRREKPEAITVHVNPGTYYLSRQLVLTPEDSGSAEAPITWQAAGDATIISGGGELKLDWKPFKNGVFKADVPAEFVTDQLFVDGERQHLARYPNFDSSIAIFNGHAADAISPAHVARWADPTGGYFHAMHPGQWGGFSYRITGKDTTGQITYEGGWQGNRLDKPHANLRFVENIFEELDAPGEWYLDAKAHTLYFYPPTGLDISKAKIEAVALRHLIELKGNGSSAPVRWINFKGFTLERTARTFMETREPLLRSDWTIYRGGAVLIEGAEDCALSECYFDQVGGNAVFVNNYNRRVTLHGCRIERSGAGGVMFVGDPAAVRSPLFEYNQRQPLEKIDRTPGPKSDNYPSDCIVDDCLITQVGRFEKQSTGVGIHMSARIIVRHCSIYDMPRAGINIGDGCWGGHIVEFCDVFDTVKETGDHGSFNSWGRDRFWLPNVEEVDRLVAENPDLPQLDAIEPTILRNTRWRCDHGWDIDLDDGSSNYQIYNNLCLQGGIKNREGYRRTVKNNVLVGNGFHPHVWFANSGDVFVRNIVWTTYQPALMREKHWGKELDFNLLHDANVQGVMPAKELQSLSKQDEHSVHANAIFVDPASGNYNVREGSPALSLGFQNFAMDNFGVSSPTLKKLARTPSFALGHQPTSRRDPTVRQWQGATVRNVVGEGERSAFGLSGEVGVVILDLPEDGLLAKAGVRRGDVVLVVGEARTDDYDALVKSGPVTNKTVKVSRDQKLIDIRID